MLAHKLKELVGPLTDLPHLNQEEVMFNGRSRLYIGNISADLNEEGILAMFAPYGQTSELFLNKEKNFGFIKLVIIVFFVQFEKLGERDMFLSYNVVYNDIRKKIRRSVAPYWRERGQINAHVRIIPSVKTRIGFCSYPR